MITYDFIRGVLAIWFMVVPLVIYWLKTSGCYELEVKMGIKRAKAFIEYVNWFKENKDE